MMCGIVDKGYNVKKKLRFKLISHVHRTSFFFRESSRNITASAQRRPQFGTTAVGLIYNGAPPGPAPGHPPKNLKTDRKNEYGKFNAGASSQRRPVAYVHCVMHKCI